MPSIGHLLLGALLGLSLYYISDKKFTKYHAFILFMNNYLGPDVGWVTDLGYFSHTVFGFIIFALPLAVIYSYFTRFSPDFKRKELTDLGKVRVPFLNTYCLVLAGGTLHNYLDGIINYNGHFYLIPGSFPDNAVTIQDFMSLWVNSVVDIGFLALFIGIPLIIGFIYYFTRLLKHTPNKALIGTVIYIAAFMVCFYLFGYSINFHNEAGAIAYVSLFWGFPLGLITLSVKIPEKKAKMKHFSTEVTGATAGTDTNLSNSVKEKTQGVIIGKVVIVFFFLIGALLLLGGAGLLVFSSYMVNWAVGNDPLFWGPYAGDLTNFFFFGGLFLVIGGLVCILAGIRLRKWDSPDFRIVLFHAWLFTSGFVCVLVAIGALTLAAPGVSYVFSVEWGSLISSYFTQPAQLVLVVQDIGILLGILGIINYFLGIGLIQRSERWRRLTFLYNICWAWSILGLVFACYLSQDDVRAKFQRSREPSGV